MTGLWAESESRFEWSQHRKHTPENRVLPRRESFDGWQDLITATVLLRARPGADHCEQEVERRPDCSPSPEVSALMLGRFHKYHIKWTWSRLPEAKGTGGDDPGGFSVVAPAGHSSLNWPSIHCLYPQDIVGWDIHSSSHAPGTQE